MKLVSSLLLAALAWPLAQAEMFKLAQPIWPEVREREMNLFIGFRTLIDAPAGEAVDLTVTASCLYRATVNGEFVGHGPVAGPHKFFRVDRWDLTPHLKPGQNVIALEVAGYYVNSFYTLKQPSFVQAEVRRSRDGQILAATGAGDKEFVAVSMDYKVQKAQRYSYQRSFAEIYKLTPHSQTWRSEPHLRIQPLKCTVQPTVAFLPRGVALCDFEQHPARWRIASGSVKTGVKPEKYFMDRELRLEQAHIGGFKMEEQEEIPTLTMQEVVVESRHEHDQPLDGSSELRIDAKQYELLDFGRNLSGFIGATIECEQPTKLYLLFDELLIDGDIQLTRMRIASVITLDLQPGVYAFETFEPHTLRYLKAICTSGGCKLSNVTLREYINDTAKRGQFSCSDPKLNLVYEAARQTLAQNSVGIFMDCPSRERAGWLCDSFFTARAAFDLCGDAQVEQNFLENYAKVAKFEHLPEGMLAMCYPADHFNGNFIPNWAMWFVLQLEEYLQRTGDKALVKELRPRVMQLLKYFEGFENSDGLLEKLEEWVFVEWSEANKFVQDVNYPTNMLYSATLASAGRIYGDSELLAKAEQVRKTIVEQSFDGTWFIDNAMREGGQLKLTENRTEVCQYYAFFCDVVTPESHTELWHRLRDEFGPDRVERGVYPDIHPTNQLPGVVLRLELLSRFGHPTQVAEEAIASHLYMAERTGTLWEHTRPQASCNHGFSSHIGHVLLRDLLGLYKVDPVNKQIQLRFDDIDLEWCRGTIPTTDGPVTLDWRIDEGEKVYRLETPPGYTVKAENIGKGILRRMP
jgi:alpha-L-rhamnosidase